MEKILISLPETLVVRMRATIPQRQRSKVITRLIEEEIAKRERELYECALQVERDSDLREEMADWNITLNDGMSEDKNFSKIWNQKTKKRKKK